MSSSKRQEWFKEQALRFRSNADDPHFADVREDCLRKAAWLEEAAKAPNPSISTGLESGKEQPDEYPSSFCPGDPDHNGVGFVGSPKRESVDAARYQYLRTRNLDTINKGGVFAGLTPDNIVLNEEDLDAAVDAAMRTEIEGEGEPVRQGNSRS